MKEVKAYVRPALSHKVIEALKNAGVTNLSIVHVKGFGLFEDPQTTQYDAEFIEQASEMMRLEIICDADDAVRYVSAIQENAHTGKSGDGAIFVSEIERAVKIKTGEEGLS